ncbi:ATP-binding protein [Kineobactrum salinum]|uniref:histidine kinase n=1 Tax=Kineobactrum salinum TaxID=2708301 RepID=A0A6C0U1H1_9GAMM|nr:ATP-binding protein [Kineobactrum salinum]QIB64175.1 HAMP domain-containing protein [Kineobactrum salinum]
MPFNSLFTKIFIGFWLVTSAVLASWLLAGHYLDSLLPDESDSRRPHTPPRFIIRLLYDLQNQPNDALAATIAEVYQEHRVKVFLLNEASEDVLGRRVPAQVSEVAQRLGDGSRRAFLRGDRRHLLAHQLYRDDLGPVRSVLVFRPNRSRVVSVLGSNLWLRLGLAILVSGLLCYLLSRLMTRPLERLRLAARDLADGQLATRLDVRTRGGDETNDLARDFNRMAEQLQQRIDAQRRLLSDVSHELRSPLARLQVALALAGKDPANPQSQLARIEREARRLDELIDELLSTQTDDSLMDEHIDLVPLLRDLCEDASYEGRATGRRVEFHSDSEHALVLGNGTLLRKAFDNILRNALHYTATDSVVQLGVSTADQRLLVTVQDQGPGIPEAELARVFDEFYRVDSARARETGGYGLGLSIARRAVIRHGGDISATNTNPGLLMQVELPLFDSQGLEREYPRQHHQHHGRIAQ